MKRKSLELNSSKYLSNTLQDIESTALQRQWSSTRTDIMIELISKF